MKLIVGSPGTWSGMGLRVSQCVFAAASLCALMTGSGYSNYSASFHYMILTLRWQFMWSLGLACVDIFYIRNNKDLHDSFWLTHIVIIDWVLDDGSPRFFSILCLRQCPDLLDEGYAILQGILATGMRSVCTFGRLGVHSVVLGCCIFFLRVLASGFVSLVISHATLC